MPRCLQYSSPSPVDSCALLSDYCLLSSLVMDIPCLSLTVLWPKLWTVIMTIGLPLTKHTLTIHTCILSLMTHPIQKTFCHHPQICLSQSLSNLSVCLGCAHKLKFTPLHYFLSLIMCSRLREKTAQTPPAAANASPVLNSAECPHHSGSIYSYPDGGFSPAGQVPSET